MSLMVKICGLRNAEDVAVAVDAGANAIGFVFAESPRRILPVDAAIAAATAPAHVTKVAVMRHPANEDWLRVLEEFVPDALQTDAADFDALDIPDNIIRWPVMRESEIETDEQLPDLFLYEGPNSGRGETVDWQRAAGVAKRGRMILAGGLDPSNVVKAIGDVRPYGVDVSSGVESSPGVKDPRLIREFMLAARAAESNV